MARRHGAFLQCAILCVVGANYLAQIPYYLHLYYFPHGQLPSASASALLGFTLLWFLAGYIGLAQGGVRGFWLLLSFLVAEVGFYVYNMLNQMLHGYPPFFHLQTRDPILWAVFAIGYLNMLLGAYFIFALLLRRRDLVRRARLQAPTAA